MEGIKESRDRIPDEVLEEIFPKKLKRSLASRSRCVGKPLLKVPKMIMKRWGILQGKEDNLVKDLKETTLSFKT
jgi:hypothetical protein